ncbi:MAG TPA: glycosyltransferase [Candidatus Baltobacteraceae bacterium]|nr:glycosyltransferase [Candidatus Baltobacteraceae bacterium]
MSHLRLGFFTEIYRPAVNGVVASVETLAEGLRERGHEVYCFAPSMPGGARSDGDVFRLPSLPLPTAPYRLTLPLVGRRNVNNVIKRLALIHVHSLFVTGWAGLRYARRYGMPIVYTYHTQLEAYAHYIPFEPKATRFAASQLTRTFCNLVDGVVAPTPAIARHLRDLGVEARIDVVPSGIDVDRFAAGRREARLRRGLGVPSGGRLLVCVTRLAREKNVELLLRALAESGDPATALAIAGDGPQRDELEHLAVDVGVADRVVFLGVVAAAELPDLYASADAFVFPSTTETQGLVQAEALAAGALVIAADTPPNREVLGDAARIVAPDPAAFARAFRDIPRVPDAAVARRAKAAAQRFSAARQVSRMIELYESLLARDPGRLDGANTRSIS